MGSFCLTSGFWIFLEVKFPLHPRESEGHFLSFLSCYNPIDGAELGRDVPAAGRPMVSREAAMEAPIQRGEFMISVLNDESTV